jgi:cobalt-zinc-cadmium efflux system membrane fusion protein
VAQVKERDIRFIHEGDDMNIYITAYPDKSLKGKVFHVEEVVDEETRSIKVLSICNNHDELLKIGMYTTIHFLDKPTDCIVIPEKALLQDEKNSFVYVRKGENEFIKRSVETFESKDGKAIVTKGLEKNDVIISEGGYYLK